LSVNRVKTPAFRQGVFNTTMEKGKRGLNRVESKDEQLSKRIAHGIRSEISCSVDHQESQGGIARRNREAVTGINKAII
jgi:hypothetical protein